MIGIVDVCILIILLMLAVIGLKRGFFKQTVITIGTVLVFILAYYFKDYLADFFSYNLPFIKFSGSIAGLSTLNIIVYQMLAFIFMLGVFTAILAVLIKITGLFEKILKFTIILSIPSKIAGFILGLIEGYVIVFIALFVLNQPAINLEILNESKAMPVILNSSVGLSSIVSKTGTSVMEIYELGKTYSMDQDSNEFNKNSIDIMLKNKIITTEYVNRLISKNKIQIDGIEEILQKY